MTASTTALEPPAVRRTSACRQRNSALTGYQGTVVVVTHDRRMRSRFNGAHLTLRNGHMAEFTTA
ncbi:hypothetical protein [Streptomyces sp. NPDC101166]|uniref:hypothetical protein n=1 Tax=Streptomyces sp. NPDC101166 TaxID=3366120 RepID=UPI0037F33BDF